MMEINKSWYFLFVVVLLYVVTGFFGLNIVLSSLEFAWKIVVNIIPVFVVVFVVMLLVNYYVDPKTVSKYLGKSSGWKRWFFAVVGGIISTGPIYMWYPMLKELKERGVNYGFISTFLYNRAIKPALIPLMIYYFGLNFTIILTFVMIVMSVIQGFIFEKLEEGGELR
ncbi:MAG: permease [Candidatus Aenigmarchaeota archaeon]|nr:permease [Candidatus Aenigmarchaeota archaeon]